MMEMDGTRPRPSAAGDRLSKLEDRVLGHVLSFLPANEAARAALLSSRWRGVFAAAVHTVSLEEPEAPLEEYNDRYDVDSWDRGPPPDPNAPPPFYCTVSNALLARGGAAPLHALRVHMEDALETASAAGVHPSTVDQWVSYAVQQAAPEGLRLDLRLHRAPLCDRRYSLRDRSGGQKPGAGEVDRRSMSPRTSRRRRRASSDMGLSDSDDEQPRTRRRRSISSNEGSPDSNYAGDRTPPPRRTLAPASRRSPSPLSSSNGEEPHTRRRRRSISSNERSPDSNYAGDRALSPRPTLAPASSRPSNDDYSPSPREHHRHMTRSRSSLSSSSDDTIFCPSPPRGHDEKDARPNDRLRTVSTVLFSCAALRSLSLGHFLLTPPAKVNLPSLETLLLSHVSDPGGRVERIIAGSPRLADLTLEACRGVATLHVPNGARLRRLALRCCHSLDTVVLDASELVAFEYRGAVPTSTFLTMHGGGVPNFAYCKVDICGAEVSSEEEVARLRELLLLFQNAKRLHLESARLGSGMGKDVPVPFPTLSDLRHLELRGRLPDDDDAVVGAVTRILGHTPNLQALSLVFHPEEHDWWADTYSSTCNEAELLDAHRLKYNGQSVLAPATSMIPCLRSSVREINLVHYQGGRTQRALAKFLLCNAPAIDRLWCEFAEGPLWTQTQLMREIKGWVMNKSASTNFL